MDHLDHVRLLRRGISKTGGTWTDLGSGDGAFTLAIRDLAGPEAEIWSIDKDRSRLENQRLLFEQKFPGSHVTYIVEDFARPLSLPPLDGMVMANSLHYISYPQQPAVVQMLAEYLKPDGVFLLVEYDAERGSPWVPYPISFRRWQGICEQAKILGIPEFLDSEPSTFMNRIYSARSYLISKS